MTSNFEVFREFETGATRTVDTEKIDPEGFLSPWVLLEYSKYMHRKRVQPDGNLRASDNWQLGIPRDAYMKSMWRHVLDMHLFHRGCGWLAKETIKDTLCAIIFNASGYLLDILKKEEANYG